MDERSESYNRRQLLTFVKLAEGSISEEELAA